MQIFLLVVMAIAIAAVALAFYRGWFKCSSCEGKGTSGITFTVDENKMAADKNRVADKLKTS